MTDARCASRVRDTGIGIAPDAAGQAVPAVRAGGRLHHAPIRRHGPRPVDRQAPRRADGRRGRRARASSARARRSGSRCALARLRARRPADARCAPAPADGRRVLVVDDNDTNRRVIGRAARAAPATTSRPRHRAIEALTAAAARRRDGPAVPSGAHRPPHAGHRRRSSSARRIRGDPAIAETRLVLYSSIDDESSRKQLRALGFAGHLSKPMRRARAARHAGARALARRARVHAAPARDRHARRDRRGPPAPRTHACCWSRTTRPTSASRSCSSSARVATVALADDGARGARGAAQSARATSC